MKNIKRIILVALLSLMVFFAYNYIKIYRVDSSSMEPAIKAGSIIFVFKTSMVKLNDIVTYQIPQGTYPVTHRIVKIINIHEKTFFISKGDNNKEEDPYPILPNEVVGKVLFVLPYLGAAANNLISYKLLWFSLYAPLGLYLGRAIKKLTYPV